MNITNEQKKEKAIEIMHKLDIYAPYIRGFREENQVCFFEAFGGFWAYQEPELMAKIKEFEHNTTYLYTPLRTNTRTSASATISFIFPMTNRTGNICLCRKKRCFTFRHTYGTSRTICVRNSERSVSVLSAAALKGLCEARYERI